ncbi:hypothetical protein A2U01_0052490, partial [Trifolium medium]|nr:hypothetical protein [Trifolium medium]
MRERGRESERRRSLPSPEVRQIRGGVSVDSGEWTEVRRRQRKEFRQVDGEQDRSWQTGGYQQRSISTPRLPDFYDRHDRSKLDARDHVYLGKSRSRYNMGWDREFHQRGN